MRTVLIALLLAAGCKKSDTEWIRFNGESDDLSIEVTASADLGDEVSIELSSTTGTVVVGEAYVDPGSGPVGTDHELFVDVFDDYEEEVGLVTVITESGERGEEEYELRQDSADHGHWVLTLTSLGEEGEVRTDTFTIALWSEEVVTVDESSE